MSANELLDELLALFSEKIPGAVFCRAFCGRQGARRPETPVVTGELESEAIKPASSETRLRFCIFLPPGSDAHRAQELFEQMCRECGQRYPAFSAISRGPAARDGETGLLTVNCALTFLSGSGGQEEPSVVLGGKEYPVSSVGVSIRRSGESLIAIGETEPFAMRGEKTEYTVELSGIETDGLSKLAAFEAVVGGATYLGCRWKSISDVLRKASFVSAHREGGKADV